MMNNFSCIIKLWKKLCSVIFVSHSAVAATDPQKANGTIVLKDAKLEMVELKNQMFILGFGWGLLPPRNFGQSALTTKLQKMAFSYGIS